MIIIQTNRVFVVPEVTIVKNIQFEAKIEQKKEQIQYIKKRVKYFIPKFYI